MNFLDDLVLSFQGNFHLLQIITILKILTTEVEEMLLVLVKVLFALLVFDLFY